MEPREIEGPFCQHQLGAALGHGCPVFLGFPLPGSFISLMVMMTLNNLLIGEN